jgi:Ca2+-binding EF-hand superfamily protein
VQGSVFKQDRPDLYGGTKFPKVDADAVSPYDVLGAPSVVSKPMT